MTWISKRGRLSVCYCSSRGSSTRAWLAAVRSTCTNYNSGSLAGLCEGHTACPAVMLQGGDLKQALRGPYRTALGWYNKGAKVALEVMKGLHFLHCHGVSPYTASAVCLPVHRPLNLGRCNVAANAGASHPRMI